jgi:hypothetical protein
MAELIQKKLQGEVEKYQQLQKGKGAGSMWPHSSPLTTQSHAKISFTAPSRPPPAHASPPQYLSPTDGITVYFLTSIFF